MWSMIEWRESRHTTQSKSVKAWNWISLLAVRKIPCPGACLRYQRIHKEVWWWCVEQQKTVLNGEHVWLSVGEMDKSSDESFIRRMIAKRFPSVKTNAVGENHGSRN